MYTPINEYKLSKENQALLKRCKEMCKFKIDKIYLNRSEFNDFLDSISAASRNSYCESIPFEGKLLVMK